MTENMKEFLEAVSANAEMMKKLDKASKDEVAVMAAELGISLNDADFAQHDEELSEDDLDTVAGGTDCVCVIGGGGVANANLKTCWCVGYGTGDCQRHNKEHCFCVAGGVGADKETCH